jgi:hypothetical protein
MPENECRNGNFYKGVTLPVGISSPGLINIIESVSIIYPDTRDDTDCRFKNKKGMGNSY